MKRSLVRIEEVADIANLSWAFWRAARGLRHRLDVVEFERDLERELSALAREILAGSVAVGHFQRFVVHDPKRRVIHAPAFRERVLHHALMRHVGPPLERSLVDDSFACRVGRGSHAAARRAQEHVRRAPWLVKVDVRRYFDSIDHRTLLAALARRIKGASVLALCGRIVASYCTTPGKGLPIGALTSQHFANLYLAAFDRWLLESPAVLGMVRYMDDVVWWCASRGDASETLQAARTVLCERLALELKASVQLQPSIRGVLVCGFRVLPDRLLLSRRRQRRFRAARRSWERAWSSGRIGSRELQQGLDSALAITAHAEALGWRRAQLLRIPAVDA